MSSNEFLTTIERQNPSLIDYDALSVSLVKIGSLNIDDHFSILFVKIMVGLHLTNG